MGNTAMGHSLKEILEMPEEEYNRNYRRQSDMNLEDYRREIREGAKAGIKELANEYAQKFGWWSIRTLGVAL